MSNYSEDLEPLNDFIEIVFETKLVPFISSAKVKYKEQIATNENFSKDLTDTIKPAVKQVLSYISNQYTTKLKTLYFSEEGLLTYVFSVLQKLSFELITGTN